MINLTTYIISDIYIEHMRYYNISYYFSCNIPGHVTFMNTHWLLLTKAGWLSIQSVIPVSLPVQDKSSLTLSESFGKASGLDTVFHPIATTNDIINKFSNK